MTPTTVPNRKTPTHPPSSLRQNPLERSASRLNLIQRTSPTTSGAVRTPAAPEVPTLPGPSRPACELLAALERPLAHASLGKSRGCSVLVDLPQPLAIRLLPSLVAAGSVQIDLSVELHGRGIVLQLTYPSEFPYRAEEAAVGALLPLFHRVAAWQMMRETLPWK
jgi:hypothetical protein